MNLSELKSIIPGLKNLHFQLEDGSSVPEHFHITEQGSISKHFIDCGGTVRKENFVSLQLWNANDYDHRLDTEKLLNIIQLSQKKLNINDADPIEVEYQGETIGKYGLSFNGSGFVLTNQQTACRAMDACGTEPTTRESSATIKTDATCCTPGSGCC